MRVVVFADEDVRGVSNSDGRAGRATHFEDAMLLLGLFDIEGVTNVVYKGLRRTL